MELTIKEIVDKKEKATIAQDILNDLPESRKNIITGVLEQSYILLMRPWQNSWDIHFLR